MYNIPVVTKLKHAVELGEVSRVGAILGKYDILIHPNSCLIGVAPPSAQVEFYELQLARYVSWTSSSLHFVERVANGGFRGRRIGFLGCDGAKAVERYLEARREVEEWYKRKYYTHKIKKGAAAAEAYRSGFLEAVLDRVRQPVRPANFYQDIFRCVRMRDILTPSRRELHDQSARSGGLDDGLVCDLRTLKSVHAESLCSGLD